MKANPPEMSTHTDTGDPADGSLRRAGAVLLVACSVTFVSFLDVTLVNLAFGSIVDSFPVPQATVTWVVSAYAIGFAACLATAGRLADSLGHKPILLSGVVLFGLSSLACAAAPSIETLIVARAVQGIAGAALLPAALGAMLAAVPPHRAAAAIGAWSATGALAAALGPAVGALLVDHWGWRSVFFVNVPACGLLLILGLAVLPSSRARSGGMPDLLGAVLVAGGIGAVVAVLTEARRWGYVSPLTLALLALGLAMLSLVVPRSYRHPRPALEVGLWANRTYALTNLASAALGYGMFAFLLAMPLYLTGIWGLSLLETAACVGATGAAAMVTAAIAGARMTARNARWFAGIGFSGMTAAFAVIGSSAFTSAVSWPQWGLLVSFLGGGTGLAITALSVLTAASVPVHSYSAGIGLNLTARQIGGALGIAVCAATIRTGVEFIDSFHQLFLLLAAVAGCAALGCGALRPAEHPSREEPTHVRDLR